MIWFRKFIALGVIISVGAFLFAWGLYSGVKQVFPFNQLVGAYLAVFPRPSLQGSWIDSPPITDPDVLTFDPGTIIDLESKEDVESKRENLVQFIFGEPTLPTEVRDLAGRRVEGGFYAELFTDIAQVYQVTAEMPLGFSSTYWRFIPNEPGDCLFIYQQGHASHVFEFGGDRIIRSMLTAGCRVVALQMPQQRENQTLHTIHDPDLGPIKVVDHFGFSLLNRSDGSMEGADGSPIRFFIEPIALALNYELADRSFDRIGMSGVSGGGWATTLYSSIDPRIEFSYPVAGSVPIYLRQANASWGDWEQVYGPMLRIANYLEMYVLGSTGEGRRQLKILNRFDPCCFHGTYHLHYEDSVSEVVVKLGGSFEIYSDSTHRLHQISEHAINMIREDFNF